MPTAEKQGAQTVALSFFKKGFRAYSLESSNNCSMLTTMFLFTGTG
jgi:hypothetical protein